MKYRRMMGVVLGLIVAAAYAGQPQIHQAVERETAFDGCHFKMADPYNGELTLTTDGAPPIANYDATINPNASHPFDTWIQFDCENPITTKMLSELAGMKKTNKGWVFDTSPESVGLPEQHTMFYAFHGKNWNAGGVTQDEITGDEERRTRIFAFCIPHHQLALCGVVRPVGYLMHLNESVLPQIIKLLESIEFIDLPSPQFTTAPGSASSAQ